MHAAEVLSVHEVAPGTIVVTVHLDRRATVDTEHGVQPAAAAVRRYEWDVPPADDERHEAAVAAAVYQSERRATAEAMSSAVAWTHDPDGIPFDSSVVREPQRLQAALRGTRAGGAS